MLCCYTIALPILLYTRWTKGSFIDDMFENQEDLVGCLGASKDVKSEQVKQAMLKVPSKWYLPKTFYEDFPDYDPSEKYNNPLDMDAYALENLKDHLKEGSKVLNVASGSGCLVAYMAYMVGNTGLIVSQLASQEELKNASGNIERHNPEIKERIKFVEGNYTLGVAEHGPYDAIHVGIDLARVPKALVNQLDNGGRLMLPITAPNAYKICIYDRMQDGSLARFVLKTMVYDRSGPMKHVKPEDNYRRR